MQGGGAGVSGWGGVSCGGGRAVDAGGCGGGGVAPNNVPRQLETWHISNDKLAILFFSLSCIDGLYNIIFRFDNVIFVFILCADPQIWRLLN